jgi:hypothetical protein
MDPVHEKKISTYNTRYISQIPAYDHGRSVFLMQVLNCNFLKLPINAVGPYTDRF